MGHLIDHINYESGKMNIHLSNGGHIQALDESHIDSVVELYRMVYEKLKAEQNEKFIHPVAREEVEELITSPDSAIVGYFKDKKHLVGVAYTKPSDPDSKYFRTPAYDEGKTSYILGGLAVDPDCRGNGIFINDVVHFNPATNIWVAKQILAGYKQTHAYGVD